MVNWRSTMIRKIRGKKLWKVTSEKTGRSFGTYTSKGLAEYRLAQIEYFKKIKGGKKHG